MDVLREKYNFGKLFRKNVHKKCKFRENGEVFQTKGTVCSKDLRQEQKAYEPGSCGCSIQLHRKARSCNVVNHFGFYSDEETT